MSKDARVYLEDILECIQFIEEYTHEMDFDEFDDVRQTQDAVMRRLEIIGEAVKNILEPLKEKHSDIPWKQIAGMRDILIHEYAGVLLDRVWNVVANDLPPLKKTIQKMLKEYESQTKAF